MKLYINGELFGDVLCPMPDWEIQRHEGVESAYVTDGEKIVSAYDPEEKRFKPVKE